jgi:hypothetical protein
LAAFDGIAYSEIGLVKHISGLTEVPIRTTEQAFADMADQGLLSRIDDKMFKIDDNYRGRNAKTKEISFGRKIDHMVEAVERARIDSWQARGKHTRGKPMKTNRDMLKEVLVKVNEINDRTIIMEKAMQEAGLTALQKEVIRRHLRIVPND